VGPAGSADPLGKLAAQPAAPTGRVDHELHAAVASLELRVADQVFVVTGQPVDDPGVACAPQREPGGLVQWAGAVGLLGAPNHVEHVIALLVGQIRMLGDHA